MSDVPYVIDASARSRDADIWFALPAGFVALPLVELAATASSPEEAGPGAVLGPLLDGVRDAETRQRLLTDFAPLQRMAQAAVASGSIHCSLGLHSDDQGDGRPLLSVFNLAWRATAWAPRSVTAARAAVGSGADQIETLDLPCGPASIVVNHLKISIEGPLGQQELLQIAAYVPCPDGMRIAILTLATTGVERADQYRTVLRDIARSISFDNPLSDAPDEE
ncbi:hypothetical protein [Streptomyces sp. NPDC057616]|uniref:hypothetical protein n=1 Tax=Streptomyces sp. NPDC057616 TaxID=3346183 RepID=UPI00368647CF